MQKRKLSIESKENKENMKKKARSRVAPFRNRAEFESVYEMIFGSKADINSRKNGCKILQIWKIRRGAETSASVLSTLAILEVQLKDESKEITSQSDLQLMYSGAVTRFINYVLSIEQKQERKKSMYSIASKLGIDRSMVDIRHQCAHGKDLPSLDIFRRHATNGMNWLKSFYWERELKYIQDTDVGSLKIHNTIRFERNLKRLLLLYDAITEAIYKGCDRIQEVYDIIADPERQTILKEYVVQLNEQNINKIFNFLITDLIMASKSRVIKENIYIFSDQLLACPFFIDSSCSNSGKLIKLHNKLLFEMQRNGYIAGFWYRCVFISEDIHESKLKRISAARWVSTILEGYELMKSTDYNHRLAPYQSKQELLKVEEKCYQEYVEFLSSKGIDIDETLVLRNFLLHPIQLDFTEEFVFHRIENLSEITMNFVKQLLTVTIEIQQTKKEQYNKIIGLINAYTINNIKQSSSYCRIYTLEEDILPLAKIELQEKATSEKSIGIFKEAPKDIDWKSIPLGTVFNE